MEHTLGLRETLGAYHEAPDTFRILTDQFPVGGVGILWEQGAGWKPHEARLVCRGAPRLNPAGGGRRGTRGGPRPGGVGEKSHSRCPAEAHLQHEPESGGIAGKHAE